MRAAYPQAVWSSWGMWYVITMLHISLNIFPHGWPIAMAGKLAQKSCPCLNGPCKEGHDALLCTSASNQLDWVVILSLGNAIDWSMVLSWSSRWLMSWTLEKLFHPGNLGISCFDNIQQRFVIEDHVEQ